ncbi:MAG: amino acid ABC transporter substrate-binding protein [Gammaproteobacteria bacterium]|nr:amino acid ABC transporter substrate-binding protein [Gammaproteobacteria bacterium]
MVLYLQLLTRPVFAEDIVVEIWVNDTHPPYTYVNNGKARGIYIDIMRLISERIEGYRMKFIPAPWQRVKKEVERGSAFAFMPPYYHGHDWPYVWPYSLPILEEEVILVCRNEVLKIARTVWPDDYLGLTIGNNTGYDGFGGFRFRQYVSEGKIRLRELKTTAQNIVTLLKGRLDCYMANRLSFVWEMKRLVKSNQVKEQAMHQISTSLVISTDAVYMGVTDSDKGKFSFKRDFLQKLNNELYKMYKSYEIRSIVDRYVN